MSEPNASFKFCLGDLTIEVTGSDLFVSQQVEPFRELIASHLESPNKRLVIESSPKVEGEEDVESNKDRVQNPYPNAIAVHGGEVSIICDAPGNSTSERAGNLCLMYIWAKKNFLEQGEVPASELRELCKEHAVYDSTNFAAHLKSRKSHFIQSGAKGSNSKSYKITHPGEAAAKILLEAAEN